MLEVIKMLHVALAVLSIASLLVRGYWMLQRSPMLDASAVRRLPHVADVLLITLGLILALGFAVNPARETWLAAKLVAVVVYIVLGVVAVRAGRRSRAIGVAALVGAVAAFAYIVAAATTRDPTPLA